MNIVDSVDTDFAERIGRGDRTRITVNETKVEFRRFLGLANEMGSIALVEGSLLAEYASLAAEDPKSLQLTSALDPAVSSAYQEKFGYPVPYNWTDPLADGRDITASHPGSP